MRSCTRVVGIMNNDLKWDMKAWAERYLRNHANRIKENPTWVEYNADWDICLYRSSSHWNASAFRVVLDEDGCEKLDSSSCVGLTSILCDNKTGKILYSHTFVPA